MRIDVFTLFPAMIDGFCSESLLGKARGGGLLDLRLHDPREQTADVHRTVDDAPFGGGAGMLMTPKPLFDSVEAADPPRPLLLLGPGGRRFDQSMAPVPFTTPSRWSSSSATTAPAPKKTSLPPSSAHIWAEPGKAPMPVAGSGRVTPYIGASTIPPGAAGSSPSTSLALLVALAVCA